MNPADVWLVAANKTKRPHDPLDAYNDWQLEVLGILQKYAPQLLQGFDGELNLSRKDVYDLTRRITTGVSTTYRERLLFLAKGIAYGNHLLGWNIPTNPILIKINREKNHITPSHFATRSQWQPLLTAFNRDLANCSSLPADQRLGQLLLSAIFYGGLIDSKWLSPWLQALLSREIYQEESWLWLEMERYPKFANAETLQAGQAQTRRWLADPLSQLLIYNHLKSADDTYSSLPPWTLLNNYLDRLKAPGVSLPRTQSELLKWAFDRCTGILPGVLAGYARGDILSTSLPTRVWLRTITGRTIPIGRPQAADKDFKPSNFKPLRATNGEDARKEEQIKLFKSFITQINPKRLDKVLTTDDGLKIITRFKNKHKKQMSIAMQMLLGWAEQLLNNRQSPLEGRLKKEPLAISSVYRYLKEIGVEFLAVSELHDLYILDPIDLELLYENVNLRKNSRRYNAHRLEYFHGYLRYFHELPKLDFAELFGGLEGSPVNVDANVITPAIYTALLRHLGWGENPDRWQTIHIIATILGYRLGLRPSEIQALRLRDILLHPQAELLIRNSYFFRTKTFAGRRRVPLSLLSQEELEFFVTFYRQREKEYKAWGNEIFLHFPKRRAGMLSDDEIFEPIRQTLRDLTGDQTLRFYSLRHTCFSQLTILLMLRDDINFEGFDLFDHPDFSEQRQKQLKDTLFGKEGYPNTLWPISLLAGHNSPRTTYKHYVHLTDWLLGYHLRHVINSRDIDYKSLSEISGLSPSTVFYHLDNNMENHPLLAIVKSQARKQSQRLRHPTMALATPIKRGVRKETSTALWLPSWDQALSDFLSTDDPAAAGYLHARKLPDRVNWPLAEQVYSCIAACKWQELKTYLPIIRHAIANYPGRWGGINYTHKSQVEQIQSLLYLCNIHHQQILVKYHPRRRQKKRQHEHYKKYWENKFNCTIVIDEEANQEGVAARGITTLIISAKKITAERLTTARRPRMSPGFIFALDLLLHQSKKLSSQ